MMRPLTHMLKTDGLKCLMLCALAVMVACGDDDGGADGADGGATPNNAPNNSPNNAPNNVPGDGPNSSDQNFDEEYFGDDDSYILARSHANVVRFIDIVQEEEPGVARGFDLDAQVSEMGDEASCGHGDLMAPDGRMGIDNQLAKMWSSIEPLVGPQARALLQGAINEGSILIMVELADLDDLRNDDDVTLRVYRGTLDPDIGNLGVIAPDQTFYYDYEFPTSEAFNVQLVDGVIEAGPMSLKVPVDILDADFALAVDQGYVRVEINDDGTFDGVFSGGLSIPQFIGELLETGAAAETRLVAPVFDAYADMSRDDEGKCNNLSAAFAFEGTTAFVIRDRSQD